MLFRGEFLFMGQKSFYIVEAETAEQAKELLCYQKEQDLKDSFEEIEGYTREDIAAQTYVSEKPIEWEGRVAYITDEKGIY